MYAESHGIVANVGFTTTTREVDVIDELQNFWDPSTGDVFDYKGQSTSWPSHWWSGEPVRPHYWQATLLLLN